jgi:hypothetical protein
MPVNAGWTWQSGFRSIGYSVRSGNGRETMEVRYSPTAWDVARFNTYVLSRSTAIGLISVAAAVSFSYSIWQALDTTMPLDWVTTLVVAMMVSLLMAGLWLFTIIVVVLATLVRGNRKMRVERVLTLSETGVSMVSQFDSLQTSWAGVAKIRKNRHAIMIFSTDCSAHVVPRRCFGGPADATAFFEYALKRVREAR